MRIEHSLRSLSDDDLLCRLSGLVHQARRSEADLVAHLAEVDDRRLYARSAATSLFGYCTEILHFSEPEACLRIVVARASKRHPVLLAMLADGRIHLSGIAVLAPHLTAENRDGLLERATHRSKRQIEELVAALSPRPDVPDRIRRLPDRRLTPPLVPPRVGSSGSSPVAGEAPRPEGASPRLDEVAFPRPDGAVVPPAVASLLPDPRPDRRAPGPGGVAQSASVEPIAAGRYRVQFTASAVLREKLERLQALMQSGRADTSLAAVIEAAVDEKLARLEAKRFGRTDKPRREAVASDTQARSRHIPASIRRAVWSRDEGRCRFVDEEGRRCSARRSLEFHHVHPFGMGGGHSIEQIRLYCGTHNRYVAEIDYGRGLPRTSTPRPPTRLALDP